jgi:hypothetical protein
MTAPPVHPQLGDYGCCPIGGPTGPLVSFLEWLNGDGFTRWDHAFVVTSVHPLRVVEAEPGGAREVAVPGAPVVWSTGRLGLELTTAQREEIAAVALGFALSKTPYSWADYLALALRRLHIPFPGLRSYIASTHHEICSALVAACYDAAGIHLFPGEWDGYVTPAMLAERAGYH